MTLINENTTSASPIRSTKLGEELPIFCERCGYNLNGLKQMRCEHCDILQFHCPECGHHQPINTLRPAAQRIIGRLRAVWLCGVVLFKLNFFGWLLFAWAGMGGAWSYSASYIYNTPPGAAGGPGMPTMTVRPHQVDYEEVIAFTLLALFFGMVGRMLLLRWRRAWIIGAILGTLTGIAIVLGAKLAFYDYSYNLPNRGFSSRMHVEPPWTGEFVSIIVWSAGVVVVGAVLVWPVWMMFVRAFLPKNVAHVLLEWQRSQSDRVARIDGPISALARE